MDLLIVQLSDIHFRSSSNKISEKKDAVLAAISSLEPHAKSCLLLVTGDIAWSGLQEEYEAAAHFFDQIEQWLAERFPGAYHSLFIPGNHDCYLPTAEVALRSAIIKGLEPSLQSGHPDPAIVHNLLSSQDNFFNFLEKRTGRSLTSAQRLCQSIQFDIDSKSVTVYGLNTALLTQRDEKAGTLGVPVALLREQIESGSDSDVFIGIYHHPLNWFTPDFKRSLQKLLEASFHFVFSGHEHEQSGHLVESFAGQQMLALEADALQDKQQPNASGFNCLLIDLSKNETLYSLFRWKSGMYYPEVDKQRHDIQLSAKSNKRFLPVEKFQRYLQKDDFGFSHKKKPVLTLRDFFVYPAFLQANDQKSSKRIKGSDFITFLQSERYVALQGSEFSGRTSLLKILYEDLLNQTVVVPVLLDGGDITASNPDVNMDRIIAAARAQYGNDLVEPYRQLASQRKALFIDNWHKSRLTTEKKRALLIFLQERFSLILITTNDTLIAREFINVENTEEFGMRSFEMASIREFTALARGALVDKWVRMGQEDDVDDLELSRSIEEEQRVIDQLIGKKTLPALPYIILGILQARQSRRDETSDPGSFGFLVQKLVLDHLSITKGKRMLIERKDAVLRRIAFELFSNRITSITESDFLDIAQQYATDVKITVDAEELLEELLFGRIIENEDGNIQFKHEHFSYYFLARHFIDEIDGPRTDAIRDYLDGMAERPLDKANRLTLIFFLFFRKRDPLIDKIIGQANATLADLAKSDMVSDVSFTHMEQPAPALEEAVVDTTVDTALERQKRLEEEEAVELNASQDDQTSLDLIYNDELEFRYRADFATARLELLGQVIRSFPDSLDGEKKVEILAAAFSLGLRHLHGVLGLLENWMLRWDDLLNLAPEEYVEARDRTKLLVRQMIAWLVRGCCDGIVLRISRAVGVNDLEQAYKEAITKAGVTPATQLIDLAIKLDHSKGFPFKDVQGLRKTFVPEAEVALVVLSDLVVRHTQIYKLAPDTLRRIAGLMGWKAVSLVEASLTE